MEQLRNRLEQLVVAESHALRNVEHTTFNRLMYRNRNQHRHAFYFRRLEQVRRLLRNIQQHVAWRSVRNALTFKATTTPKSHSSSPPLALSTVTHADLNSLQTLYTHLVTTVIPSAAKTVTTQLVARSHFLPFAVTVLSILSRLHVLENNIFKQLQGALLELELLLFVHNRETRHVPPVPNSSSTPDQNKEDLGIQIDVSRAATAQQRLPAALAIEHEPICPTANHSQSLDKLDNFSKPPPYKRAKLSNNTVNAQHTARTSLYQRMSSQDPPGPVPLTFTARAAVPIPRLTSTTRDKSKNDAPQEHTDRGRNEAHGVSDSGNSSESGHKVYSSHTDDGGNATATLSMKPDASANKSATFTAHMKSTPTADSSDSEDLDDIFGALDD